MIIRRLKRTCGHCENCKKSHSFVAFFCKVFGYKVFERSSAIGCKYYHRFHKNRYPIGD